MGGYELDADHLKFTQTAGTMMACLQGMDTEKTFLQSLGHVTFWKIAGQSLELFDQDGKSVARFEARYMK
jgi:heat shock protein HslJ